MNDEVVQIIKWSDWLPVVMVDERRFPDEQLVKIKTKGGTILVGNSGRFNWGQSLTNDYAQIDAYQVVTEIEE